MFEEHPPHKKQKVQANNNHPNMSERLFQRSSLVNPSFNYDEWMLRPEPTEVPLFLETPYNFCPRDDFINNTFVDVSENLPTRFFGKTLISLSFFLFRRRAS